MSGGDEGARARRPPLPLLIGFGVFLLAMGYLVAASLTRRTAPTFAPTAAERVRDSAWVRGGDTITVDARDDRRWRYISLTLGRVLSPPDTAAWELAVRRYSVASSHEVIDFGDVDFDALGRARDRAWAAMRVGPARVDTALGRWYRYSLLTHLLESARHVYVVRSPRGEHYKVQVLSYYCPGLTAGCMTLRYAPLAAPSE